jgi:2-haloacid dehalogenase
MSRLSRRAFLGSAAACGAKAMPADLQGVKALTFDVFGTVVDWRSSIVREGRALGERKGLSVDWEAFADAWRGGYGPSMARVRSGELPWMTIDQLHRLILDGLLVKFEIKGLSEGEIADFNRAWHRLDPWPDAVEGLTRLKRKYVIATLSNGNVALLVNMAKRAGLPWDAVLSAEMAHHYKPDAEVYRKAADLLGLETREVMMVAAHPGDLRAAAATGMRTGYVPRPLEWGKDSGRAVESGEGFDVAAGDFLELADRV